MAVAAPISETPAMEFKFGSCDRTTAAHVNTKYHSTFVNGFAEQLWPHNIWKKSFMVEPPMIISATHVPPDRYIIGNRAKIFPILSPREEEEHISLFISIYHIEFLIIKIAKLILAYSNSETQ